MMIKNDAHRRKTTAAVKGHTVSKCIHTGTLPFTARAGYTETKTRKTSVWTMHSPESARSDMGSKTKQWSAANDGRPARNA
jgi:hypothetical protein